MHNKIVTGYAAVFGNLDSEKDIIKRGAFKKHIRQCRNMPVLYAHKTDEPIGRILSAQEDKYGLFVTMEIFHEISKGKDVIALINGRMRLGLSIGYTTMKSTLSRRENTDIRHLEELWLCEISVTTNPANDLAIIRKKKK